MSPCVSPQNVFPAGTEGRGSSRANTQPWLEGLSHGKSQSWGTSCHPPHPLLQCARLDAANPKGCPSSGSIGEAQGVQAERTGIGTRRRSWSSTPLPVPAGPAEPPHRAGELAAAAAERFRCVGGRVSGAAGARASCSALARLAHRDLPGTGEAEVVFSPRWQNRRAGRAGGTQSLLLSSLAPSWGRRWKRACCFLPSCASSSSGPAPLPNVQLARRKCLSPGSGAKASG